MDKIISLLKEIGATDELAGAVSEELKRFDEEINEKYQSAYQAKLQKAKQVCVEEVENYKLDLANKVSIFLEGKSSQIEKRLEHQRAIEEGNAMSKLRSIREITENIEVASDAEIKALKEKLNKALSTVETLSEEKKRAEIAANRANEMALQIIRENREATKNLEEGIEDLPPALQEKAKEKQEEAGEEKNDVEEEDTKEEETKTESKKKKNKVTSESIKRRAKKSSKPKTTRRTLVESQVPASSSTVEMSADDHIVQIANEVD